VKYAQVSRLRLTGDESFVHEQAIHLEGSYSTVNTQRRCRREKGVNTTLLVTCCNFLL